MLRRLGLNPPPNGGKAAENRQFANSAVRLIPNPQILWYDGRRCEFRFPARRSGCCRCRPDDLDASHIQ